MKKSLLLMLIAVVIFCLAGMAHAITILQLDSSGGQTQVNPTWESYSGSPSGGTTVTDIHGDGSDWQVEVGKADFGAAEYDSQTSAIYGAGTYLDPAYGYRVYFDFDGYTWNSYNITQPVNPGAEDGYWDVFAVNINQTDYYWNVVGSDPIVSTDPAGDVVIDSSSLGGITWAWGGLDYDAGYFEEEHGSWYIDLIGDANEGYYVSAVLDTITLINADNEFPSWGAFNVQGDVTPPTGGQSQDVPEPTTMLLLCPGLIGLAGLRRKFGKR